MFLKSFICEKIVSIGTASKSSKFPTNFIGLKVVGKALWFPRWTIFFFFDDYAKIIIVSDGGISLKQINM